MNGERRLSDPFVYEWLWFSGRASDGSWISVPAHDVPADWIEWHADGSIVVSREPRVVPPHRGNAGKAN